MRGSAGGKFLGAYEAWLYVFTSAGRFRETEIFARSFSAAVLPGGCVRTLRILPGQNWEALG